MRTIGQWTRKVRGMAAEFQNQFQEAMREAEMADLKKQVDDMASDITNYDPLKSVRDDVETMGKDIEKSLDRRRPSRSTAEPRRLTAARRTAAGRRWPTAALPAPARAGTAEPLIAEPAAAEPADDRA